MKITIEPSKDQRGETYPYSVVSVEYPHDDVDIETMMGEVVKVIQAWGFHNKNIAEHLDEEFAHQLGLCESRETWGENYEAYHTADAISKDVIKTDPAPEQDNTPECEGEPSGPSITSNSGSPF